jgi:hypothetical protein
MDPSDPYQSVDPILKDWTRRRGIAFATESRGDPARTFWVQDRRGNARAQLWLGVPDPHGSVTVTAAALDLSSPSKWGPRETRYASIATLDAALDELLALMMEWAGPGAYADGRRLDASNPVSHLLCYIAGYFGMRRQTMPDDVRELPAAQTDNLSRFLGGTPLAVAVRLILLSILVGVVLSTIGFDPWNIIDSIRRLFLSIWNLGFDAINWVWRYFLLGAVIVVPIWLITRLMNQPKR